MTEQEKQRQIDALVERIDAFMKNGGGRMRVTGGEGEAQETRCAACCGEGAAEADVYKRQAPVSYPRSKAS